MAGFEPLLLDGDHVDGRDDSDRSFVSLSSKGVEGGIETARESLWVAPISVTEAAGFEPSSDNE